MSRTVDRATTIVALLHGPDQPGLVANVARWIFEHGGNIIHADQHRDGEALVFFQRVEWAHDEPEAQLRERAAAFRAFAEGLGMHVQTALSTDRPRVAVMVTKDDHCFHDLALRWRAGELPCEIAVVIGNHDHLRADVEEYRGLEFHHVPKTAATKAEAEARELALLEQYDVDLLVLARYMQVLSADFLARFGKPVINIHHSFLPAFAGANPYRQAHERGVKLIGATAHYVTEQLDEGPIVHQAVDHVNHRHGLEDLKRKGANLEKVVLSTAVLWHLQYRVLAYGRKTVAFE